MQNNPAVALSGGEDSVDHGSSFTDASSLEDENYIALLQYRDAHHILNLHPTPPDSTPPSPGAVQRAYDNAREEAQLALEQFEAKHRLQTINNTSQSRRNTVFFVSQLNYLELKLQALDQAYEELMPPREDAEGSFLVGEGLATSCAGENDDGGGGGGRRSTGKTPRGAGAREATAEDAPFDGAPEDLEEDYPPSSGGPRREFVWGGDDDGGGVDVAKANTVVRVAQRPQHQRGQEQQPQRHQQRQQQSQKQHKRESSDDDIVAIDIYFRPSLSKSRDEKPRAKSPMCDSHPSDVSSCTWDGSSIFSMISGPKNGAIDASGLSDFLGLKVPTSGDDRGDKDRRVDLPHPTRRPPLGIDVRQAMKKGPSVESPTSVTDFLAHAKHDDPYHDHITEKSRSVEDGRGRTTVGSSRHHARAAASPHDSVEAARMGILRALSEENSVCLPMEDDEHERYGNDHLNISNASSGLSDEALFNKRSFDNFGGQRLRKGEFSSKRFFQGKSDQMPKDSNSLMSSVIEGRVDHRDRAPGPQPRSCTADAADGSSTRERIPSPMSLTSSTSTMKGQRTNSNSSESSPSTKLTTNSYSDAKLEPRDDRFGDILQVGMELADELCTALNYCWSGLDVVAHRRMDHSSHHNEEESTLCTKSTYNEDQSYVTRSVGTTEGGSTAFNTESSFSTHGDSQKFFMEKRRRVPMRNASNTRPFRQKMDPPMQRMV